MCFNTATFARCRINFPSSILVGYTHTHIANMANMSLTALFPSAEPLEEGFCGVPTNEQEQNVVWLIVIQHNDVMEHVGSRQHSGIPRPPFWATFARAQASKTSKARTVQNNGVENFSNPFIHHRQRVCSGIPVVCVCVLLLLCLERV